MSTDAAAGRQRWQRELAAQLGAQPARLNRSGIEIEAMYGPEHWNALERSEDLGYPGQPPFTRGIYASMHRGRPWTPRMVVGLGVPEDYNRRMRDLYAMGLTGLFVSPCNSHLRGFDADEVERELLGTCGTLISTSDDMERCLDGLPYATESVSIGDTAPYTLSAMFLEAARRAGVPWHQLAGTTNQSDYLSHFVALHMFYRLELPGQRRILLDHIDWMGRHVPRWNPLSIVSQHMEEAGATPAQAVGFALSSAIQYAVDLSGRGHDPDSFLPRFSFFMSCSTSFFEEIAKFRAARRVWARTTRERFGAQDPRSMRLRFHAQTSGADLTREEPLNNVSRVTVQAMAAIFGGTQSLHTDSFDEAITTPTPASAKIAVATQAILRHEAHLDDVIDPMAGSFYVEHLTDQMEAEIEAWIAEVDRRGGMYEAAQSGYIQSVIGEAALDHQLRIESGEQTIVGVTDRNGMSTTPHAPSPDPAGPISRPDPRSVDEYLERLTRFRTQRDHSAIARALDHLGEAFDDEHTNTYEAVVDAIAAGATHGEVCRRVREAVGTGRPKVMI